ncbi:hypothetical protein Leryth_003244 [Lithospermum erythrorhizon]|nr:hypothetical protein Leryth_003244 [Lithospermum erythrorhizon]
MIKAKLLSYSRPHHGHHHPSSSTPTTTTTSTSSLLNPKMNPNTPSRTIYSDRFIPSRSSSNFALFDLTPPSTSSSSNPSSDDSNSAYKTLLRAALFGPGVHRPRQVLDAPALQDDFYLNLVDWSSQNVLAVGLGNCVYLWHASSSKVRVVKLCDLGLDDSVCSVGWAQRGTHLAIGTSNGKLQIWDASRCKKLFVWNQHSTQPVLKYCEHTAAVKAIAWSPHLHGLLASGGGTADRCIRFWNTTTNSHVSCMDTGSQVCNLVWSKNVNEIVSTHGYSQNQIIVWKYPTMSKLATLTGHTYRVLYLAISPDGQTIVTGAGDETLRFWNVFPSPKSQNSGSKIGASSLGRTQIR